MQVKWWSMCGHCWVLCDEFCDCMRTKCIPSCCASERTQLSVNKGAQPSSLVQAHYGASLCVLYDLLRLKHCLMRCVNHKPTPRLFFFCPLSFVILLLSLQGQTDAQTRIQERTHQHNEQTQTFKLKLISLF